MCRRMPTDEEKELCSIVSTVPPKNLNELVKLLDGGKIRMNQAKTVLETMMDSGKASSELISAEDMAGVNQDDLLEICRKVIGENAGNVADYLGGKERAIQPMIGAVMRTTKGKADAKAAQQILKQLMEAK